MGWGTLSEAQDVSGTIPEIWDGSGDPWGGPGRVGEPSLRSWMVGGPSRRSGTCRLTLGEGQDGSGDLRGGAGQVG